MKISYTLSSISHNELDAVYEMCNFELGQNYIKKEFFIDSITNKKSIVRVAKIKAKTIGFSIAILYTKDELIEYLTDKRAEQLVLPPLENQLVGITKIVVVLEKFKKNGIGIDLLNDSLKLIGNHQIGFIFGFAWKSKNSINAKRILERNNFKEILEIKNFWNDESIRENYSCPDCGNPPCVCSAVIFMKSIIYE
ncbi:MAG: hypothetical protein HYR91_03565 [Flavobacteriia bacterium]|nr:hypothetical protein [Flavobacteriia bacterium]